MYNLNINMATSAANAVNNLLSVENSCTTPRTPEILNSLIAMTNPLDNYNFGDDVPKKFHLNNMSSDSNSSSCSQESRTNGNSIINGLNSVQQTCSQLIKAGLKLSIEQKRKLQSDSEDLLDLDKVKRIKRNESESEEDKYHNTAGYCFQLTPEDEERRRRRRERNKIAATKCRLKKRERTANLVAESETLEAQNVDLKSQLQDLQNQNRHLIEILTIHKASCQKNIRPATRETAIFNRIPPHSVIESNHSYSRPASVDSNYRAQTLDTYSRPSSTGNYESYTRSTIQYANRTTPNIIVESVEEEYQTSLTDLDNPSETYSYNNQQCHNYSGNQQSYGVHGIDGCMA